MGNFYIFPSHPKLVSLSNTFSNVAPSVEVAWSLELDPVTADISSVACVLSSLSHVQLYATLWTIAHQAQPSMRFSRQEYWSGLQCPPPGDLPNPGIEPMSLSTQALAGRQVLYH